MADLESMDHVVKLIADILDLVPDAFDLYLVGLQLAPSKVPGFMAFRSNPAIAGADPNATSGVPNVLNLKVTVSAVPGPPYYLGLVEHFAASVPGGVAPLSFAWSFGDGFGSTSAAPDHEYNATGTYQVTVQVIDGNGNIGYGALQIIVNPSRVP